MKQFYTLPTSFFSKKLMPIFMMAIFIFSMVGKVGAQTTTTRFNDGYLSVFRQTGSSVASSFTLAGTWTSGSQTITVASTATLVVGMSVTVIGIAGNSAIQTIANGTTFTVSLATIALGTASTLTFNAALTSAGTAIYLDEYLPGTASQTSPNYTVTLLSSGSAGIVAGGATASNGAISRSENGRYILVPGWSTGAGGAAIGAPNTSNTLCAVKPISGSGSIQTGITGASNWFTAANDFRDVTSEDLTNYWLSGASIGIRTTTNGTALTTISTTSTNTRSVNIINGQLYYSTGSETQGV